MRFSPIVQSAGRFSDWRLAAWSILGFWLLYLATVMLRALVGGAEATAAIPFRAASAVVGVVLSLVIYFAIRLLARNGGIRRMVVVALATALPASIALSAISLTLAAQVEPTGESRIQTREGVAIVQRGSNVRIVRDDGDAMEVTLPPVQQMIAEKLPSLIADGAVTWFFLFAAWSAFFIAMSEQQRHRLVERRLADAESAAQAAQVRALRYQVNPHFLFNTLNSLSSLVMTGRSDRAEAMLLALSTFFRSSLSLDPSADVTLAQEIDLQRLYLDIEEERFPDRLRVEIEVPDELKPARLPALILQPIVENAIKYGVSNSRKAVVVRIAAKPLDNSRMCVEISNWLKSGGKEELPAATHEGTGVGLGNVCQRLEARFGARASCRFGPMPGGGYKVSLTMPVETDG